MTIDSFTDLLSMVYHIKGYDKDTPDISPEEIGDYLDKSYSLRIEVLKNGYLEDLKNYRRVSMIINKYFDKRGII